MTIPKINRQADAQWPWVLAEDYTVGLDCLRYALPFHFHPYFQHAVAQRLKIYSGYAFDGVTSPILKRQCDAIPSLLAAALIHDVLLQAKRECPKSGISWADTVNGFREACRLFAVPQPVRIIAINAVGFWFNPLFNRFRK